MQKSNKWYNEKFQIYSHIISYGAVLMWIVLMVVTIRN
jgi:hypothetical protein